MCGVRRVDWEERVGDIAVRMPLDDDLDADHVSPDIDARSRLWGVWVDAHAGLGQHRRGRSASPGAGEPEPGAEGRGHGGAPGRGGAYAARRFQANVRLEAPLLEKRRSNTWRPARRRVMTVGAFGRVVRELARWFAGKAKQS